MKITMRLYRAHDYDLMYMRALMGKNISTVVKEALVAYVRKQKTDRIDIDPAEELIVTKVSKNTQFHVYLSQKTDADIIAYIQSIKKGYRNSALKNILRSYLSHGYMGYVYGHTDDIIFVDSKELLTPTTSTKNRRSRNV